jgi:hypothetical protein
MPVIHPGPLQIPVIQLEAQWSDQPELGTHSDTAAANVPGILRDIWLVEHDMQNRHDEFLSKQVAQLVVESASMQTG